MRRLLLAICLLTGFTFVSNTANAQAVRHNVCVEIATGTWCTYCPGSALGADDLVHNGHSVAIIEHHDGDDHETAQSAARITYYGITGFPTTVFDGDFTDAIVGGNASTSIYPSYLPKYNAAIAVATPFDMTISWTQNGSSVDVTIDVEQMGAYSGNAPVLHLVATESHIAENWLAGLTEVNFVNRTMVPSEAGTPLTISQGQTVTTNLSIPIDATWDQTNMEIVAFVQDPTAQTIYNTVKSPLATASGQFDPSLTEIANPFLGNISCATSYAPEIIVKNLGSDIIAEIDFEYSVTNANNDLYNGTYTWTGSLGFLDNASAILPALNFYPTDAGNQFEIHIAAARDAAGSTITDAVMTNNAADMTWDFMRTTGDYIFSLTTDDYGYETYWQIADEQNNVVAHGGNDSVAATGGGAETATATDPGAYGNNVTITETVSLSLDGCYTLMLLDDFSDGICCTYGNGSYSLTDPNSSILFAGGYFTVSESGDWHVGSAPVAAATRIDTELEIFPNPSNGEFTIRTSESMLKNATLSVISLDGRVVYQSPMNTIETSIKLIDVAAGTYLVKMTNSKGIAIKKMEVR